MNTTVASLSATRPAGLLARFADLKISFRLYAGFGAVLVLLAGLGAASWFGLRDGAQNTASVEVQSKLNDLLVDADLALAQSENAVRTFVANPEQRPLDAFHAQMIRFQESVAKAQAQFTSPENRKAAEQMVADAPVLRATVDKTAEMLFRRAQLIESVVNGTGADLRRHFESLRQELVAAGDIQNMATIADVAEAFSGIRIVLARVLLSNNEAHLKRVIADFETVRVNLDGLEQYTSAEVAPKIKTAQDMLTAYEKGVTEIAKITVDRNTLSRDTLVPVFTRVKAAIDETRKRIHDRQTGIVEIARGAADRMQLIVAGTALAALLLGLIAAWAIARGITRPIQAMVAAMGRLADRDWSVEVPARARRDEIGDIARAVQVFKENGIENEALQKEAEENRIREARQKEEQAQAASEARAEKRRMDEEARIAEERRQREADEAQRKAEAAMAAQAEERRRKEMQALADGFEQAVGAVVEAVGSASVEMRDLAERMVASVDATQSRAATVAAASEQASANVQTVAAATEELASSVHEISRQVQTSTRIAGEAVTQAGATDAQVKQLTEGARRIGEIVTMIQNIASQTNLLALNATIEAARAGEAGKGFAVVASEVKMLANQTAKATDDIGTQISAIQASVGEAAASIQSISQTIGQVSEIAMTISSAVEEQGAATQEIARNVQQAATGTLEVSSNIAGVSEVAMDTRGAADRVLGAAGGLSRQADALRQEVASFVQRVRAA